MPIRPLLLVATLAGGDYLLWTWSSEGNSPTVALISGLALVPLLLALLWLISLGLARALLSRSSSPRTAAASARRGASRRRAVARLARTTEGRDETQAAAVADLWDGEEKSISTKRQGSSEKIAA